MKKRVVLFSVILLIFNSPGYSQYLSVSGKEIVDGMGQPVLLRGMGLGGWLVPEGYQLHIPGFGSPSDIESKVEALVGTEEARLFWERYRDAYVTEADIQRIAAWGFNSIRIPFNYRLLSPEAQPDVILEEGFEIIDRLLAWCERSELYLILDLHCAPGGQNKDNISDSDGIEARLWTDEANKQRTIALWKIIADRYSDEPWIGGYDLINEPVLPSGVSAYYLRKLYMDITAAIREVDTNHIVFIEGNWYATDFTGLFPLLDDNMVLSFHKYWNRNSKASIQDYLDLSTAYTVPLWMGESGENSNTWFSDCVDLLEENGIGWCWWTHKKVSTLTSPLSAVIPAGYQRILAYWQGQGGRPTQEMAVAGLSDLTEALELDNCQDRPGVLEALFSDSFDSDSSPFRAHIIPGVIPAEDYDFGSNGVAYSDADYQNTGGPGGGVWNRGWTYRNDGVDLEVCADAGGTGYNVGWTEDGEWLTYTVQIAVTGEYAVEIRTAAAQGGGECRLLLDGEDISGVVSIPASGGFQTWRTVTLGSASLVSGTRQLTLQIIQGGFNINYLRFSVLESGKGKAPFSELNDNISLGRPYPNPFQRTVRIPVIVREPAEFTLKIYSVTGGLVKDLSPAEAGGTGITVFQWDGTDMERRPVASGVYVSRLESGGKSAAFTMTCVE
ncbi:cellulase family glycosylhydrolase [bacterium]|nr:cellulase family glycosylhydrolase [bacterium]